jgi:hypothetical protein
MSVLIDELMRLGLASGVLSKSVNLNMNVNFFEQNIQMRLDAVEGAHAGRAPKRRPIQHCPLFLCQTIVMCSSDDGDDVLATIVSHALPALPTLPLVRPYMTKSVLDNSNMRACTVKDNLLCDTHFFCVICRSVGQCARKATVTMSLS